MKHQVHKIAEWINPIRRHYEDWLMAQGYIEEVRKLNETVKELNEQYLHDWNMVPFEFKVSCRRNWIESFMMMVQGLGYPNLLDVGYANDL